MASLTIGWTFCFCFISSCTADKQILSSLATPEATEKLSSSLNRFGLELFQQLIKEETNMVVSPFGIGLLLSALLIGARGKTAKEINETLHYEDISLEELTTAFHDIFILENLVGFEMDIYKAMVFQKGIYVEPNFGDIVGRMLFVEGKSVNFENPSTLQSLNKYVNDGSGGKLPKLFDDPFDSQTQLLLVNAMCFKGVWLNEFDPKHSKNMSFYNKGKSKPIFVEMMNQVGSFPYVDSDDLQSSLLKLPYAEEEGHMIIVLPRSRNGITILENGLSLDLLHKTIASMKPTTVNVTLPKFTITNTFGMKPVLKEMGLKRAFDKKLADFFGLIGIDYLSVTDVHQKNTLELNEHGTVASHAGFIRPRSGSLNNISFTVDHPFLYLIVDKQTNITFFIGHILNL